MILITDGVGESDLGMVMVFCHPNQVKIEACDALPALHLLASSDPSMVVVRRYSNTPYIPRVMSHTLYLDMDTFSRGIASAQFPLDRLHLCWLLPFSESEVQQPNEGREEGLKTCPHLPEFLWDRLEEEHHLSNPISLSIPLLAPALLLEECTQTKVGLNSQPCLHPDRRVRVSIFSQTSMGIQSSQLSRRHRNWLKGGSISKPKRPGSIQCRGHRCLIQLMLLYRRCCLRQFQWRLLSYYPGAFLWWCLFAI